MIKFETKKKLIINNLFVLFLLFCIGLFVFIPQIAMQSFLLGVRLWATKVLPALLPFFILFNLLSYTTFTTTIGKYLTPITKKLYGVGGVAGYVYIMSILSGYPVGAKITAELYKRGSITKGQAYTISAFTSTSGPLFVLGTVGIGLFNSRRLGITILISHYIGALLNGIIYKHKNQDILALSSKKQEPDNILNESMTGSIKSILVVGGFIAIFYMILSLLLHINAFDGICKFLELFNIEKQVTLGVISGIIEVTTGATLLTKCFLSFKTLAILLSFLISFGGLSIHAQAYCFIKDFDMKYSKFLLQKTTHAILSATITTLMVMWL